MFKTINTTVCDVMTVNVKEHTFDTLKKVPYNGTEEKTLKTVQKTLAIGTRAVAVMNIEKIEELREMDTDTFIALAERVDKYDPNRVCRTIRATMCDVMTVNTLDKSFSTVYAVPYNGTEEKTLKTVQKTLAIGTRAVAVQGVRNLDYMMAMDFDTFIANSKVVNK